MKQLHLTVLEALHWGMLLHGKKSFQQWKTKLEERESMGLLREKMSWSIPQAPQQKMPHGHYLQLTEAEKQLLRSRLREASAAASKRAVHLSDDEVDQLIERARSESYEERRTG